MPLDLRKIGALAAKLGFSTAGNTRVGIALSLGASGAAAEYDPATDAMTADPAAQTITLDARGGPLMAIKWMRKDSREPRDKMQDGDVPLYSHTLGIEAASLPVGAVISSNDIVTEAGKQWSIISVEIDPAKAMWILEMRK